MKSYYIQYNIGSAKYVLNHHDGKKKHNDNSPFYDVSIFNNKYRLKEYILFLKKDGYRPLN